MGWNLSEATGWCASWTCFYCSNPINSSGSYVVGSIRHHYKTGGIRESQRRFHTMCFRRFELEGGRPFNPWTQCVVLESEEVFAEDSKL